MMLDGWLGLAVAVLGFTAGIVGMAWAVVGSVVLKRRVLSLEFDVADLQDRLLREVKSRAGKAGARAKTDDEEFAAKLVQQQPKPNQPWWLQHVQPDLLKQ